MNTHPSTAGGSRSSRKPKPPISINPGWFSLGALVCLAVLLIAILSVRGEAQIAHSTTDSQQTALVESASLEPFISSVGFTVADMDRALDFYTRVLTFEKVSDIELTGEDVERLHGLFGVRMRVCRLKLGEEILELTEYLAPSTGRPIPPDSRSNDRWFQHIAIIVSDMDRAYEHLRQHKVRHASTGPQTIPSWNVNAGGIRAFYFKDPDNHVLEVLWFPPDRGAAKWHAPTDRLFLGIDHTAIVVADTEESLKFYRDVLGMNVAGGAENFGSEQERLNNVFGARLRITSLRFPGPGGQHGPAIELLEYLAPADGKPFPTDTRACDLWHWQVNIETANADRIAQSLATSQAAWISPGVIHMESNALDLVSGLAVRDPDGHALRVVQRASSRPQ